MDERMRFVIRLKGGESMIPCSGSSVIPGTAAPRSLSVTRSAGWSDRTLRPFRYASQLPQQVEAAIVAARRETFTGKHQPQ